MSYNYIEAQYLNDDNLYMKNMKKYITQQWIEYTWYFVIFCSMKNMKKYITQQWIEYTWYFVIFCSIYNMFLRITYHIYLSYYQKSYKSQQYQHKFLFEYLKWNTGTYIHPIQPSCHPLWFLMQTIVC